ncbi:MAG TPA: hypothetical protein VF267_04285 [Gammaproteobacteria bacterium]
MPQNNRFFLWVCAILAVVPFAASSQESGPWTLQASEWSRPRNGDAVLQMQPVADAVRAWQATSHAFRDGEVRLLLVHPGGEEGSLWAAELRDWLVALGIPPDAIDTSSGDQPPGELELQVRVTGGSPPGGSP